MESTADHLTEGEYSPLMILRAGVNRCNALNVNRGLRENLRQNR